MSTNEHDAPRSMLDDNCSASYMTPYATVIVMTSLYLLVIFYFCKNGKKLCTPVPDSLHPYQKRLKQLKRELKSFIIEDENIEVDDEQIGRTDQGIIFKGGVFPKTRNRFNIKVSTAIKISFPNVHKSMSLLEDSARLSKLDHENIIQLIAVSRLSFTVFRPMIALEWLPGGSLADFFATEIRSKDDMSRPQVQLRSMLSILHQISKALKYIHECVDEFGQELTHGRILPRNILLSERDLNKCTAKIGDFGDPPYDEYNNCPTVTYLPPEILCCVDRVPPHRPENDVWMFGILTWQCLTLGAQPYYQKTVEDIRKCFKLPDRGLPCPPTCPHDVCSFVNDCLSEAHMRPRFSSSIHSSIPNRLLALKHVVSTNLLLHPMPNISMCTCLEHRCQTLTSQ